MNRVTRHLLAIGLVAALGLLVAAVAAATPSAKTARQRIERKTIVIKADSEHGKKGPDGKWHDAFLPANFTVKKGVRVIVTFVNYDNGPHSFTSPGLHVNKLIPGAKGKTPRKVTFAFTATKAGKYLWWCNQPCDPYAMAHTGFMRGYVTVVS